MNKSDFYEWGEKFGSAWSRLDVEGALAMLSKDVEYYESNFSPACSSWEEVVKLWEVVPRNQKNVVFNHEVIVVEGDFGCIRWQVSRDLISTGKHQKIDGIFIIQLNSKGLCTIFRQWRSVVEG